MTISFTLHALERMKSRGISRSEVLSCLENPDKVIKLGGAIRALNPWLGFCIG
ncbi:MAG: DUF4258 domain-containing protein [Candidatus Bathyarchaeia archaeon]